MRGRFHPDFTGEAQGSGSDGGKPNPVDPVRAEQIETLYRNAPLGVIGAGIAGIVLAWVLARNGGTSLAVIALWLGCLWADVVVHLWFCLLRRRSWRRDAEWRLWANRFTWVSFAEGLTWGVATLALAPAATIDQQIWIMLVASGVASGAASAFGSYLPAFYVLILPAMAPYIVWSALRGSGLHDALALLDLLFITALCAIAWRSNSSLVEALCLRFENLDLARRLGVEKTRAEQANLEKSRFLAAASHDLRQPVHALGLFLGALRAREMDAGARRIVEHIDHSVQSLDGLFSALLDISRLDAGIVQARPEVFPIQPLLERLRLDHAAEAEAKGIFLRLAPCSARVHTDPLLLERILRNLVSNALRYTDSGGILLGCRRGRRLSIEVRDTGRGIPEDKQALVFQEFYQVGNPERDRAQGLGLGLAIVKRLTALLDCPMSFASEPGKGTVFKVAAPIAPGAPREAVPEVAAPADGMFQPRGLILVIDDESEIRRAMHGLLSSWGHEVIAAGGCDEMLELLASCPRRPSLIISDYRPRGGENGIAAIRRLQSEYNEEIPGVLITGDTAPERLREARASDLTLLHKPLANARLRAVINRHLLASCPLPGD